MQPGTKRAINIVRLAPQASAEVYQMVTEPSNLQNASSVRTRKLVQNSTPRVRNLAVSHASGRVVKLVPHSSTRVARFIPTSSTRVSHLVSNVTIRRINTISHSSKNISSLVPNPSPRSSQSMTNALTRKKQQQGREESLTRIQESIPNPLSLKMQLSSTPAQHLGATSSPKIAETAPCSLKKVAPLDKFSSTKAADLTVDSPTASSPRAASKPSIKSIQRLTKGDSNSNIVMVLPVPGNEATIIESQTICRLEKIQLWKDVTRVQQVIGVQRQHRSLENHLLPSVSPKLGIVTPQIIEPRLENNVPEVPCRMLKGENNVESKKETAEVQEVPAETSEEANFVPEDEKPSESRNSANDLVDIKNESFSAAKKTDTEEPEVEVVDVKVTTKEADPRRKKSRTSAPKRRKNSSRDSDNAATTRMATRMRKSTILKTRRRNTRSAVKPNQARPQISAVARMQGQLTKTIASLNISVRNKWRAQCIICNDRFTDKYDFHRHVTLSHPGIRIVFCELCNASFRTDIELQQHRYSYHKITVTKDAKNNLVKLDAPIKPVVDLENESRTSRPKTIILDDPKPVNRKKTANAERRNLEPTAGSRSTRKRVTASCMKTGKLKRISQVDPVGIGPRRKRSQNKRKSSKRSYVDIDIIDHEAITNNETLINAEKRKLIIPIMRLAGSVVEKHLPKFVKTPETNYGSTRINDHPNSQKKKSTIKSSQKKRFVNLRSNRVGNKSASRATRLTSRKRRRTSFAAKNSLGNEKNAIISQDPQVVELNDSKREASVAPRRSLRSRKAKKSFDCNSDKTSIDGLAKTESLGVESTTNRESCDFTLVYIEDEPEVAEVIAEQEVIKKRVSRSSVSISSTTFDDDRPEIDAEFDPSEIKDGEKESTKRRSSASPERQSSEFKDPRCPRPENSTLIGSDEKLVVNKRSPSTPRFSCLNLYEGRLLNSSDNSKNCDDGEPDGISKKRDKKAVVKKNIRKNDRPVGRRKLADGQAKDKSDDKSPPSEERIDGEDNKEKKENGGGGKNLDEKSSGGGNRSNVNSNQEEKHSKATSVTDTLRKKQSDDEDEEPKRRNNDEDKKPREKIDEEEDDEKDEKERKSQDDLVNETKYEETTNENQSKPSTNGHVVKTVDKKNNVSPLNQKEIKKSTDTLELSVRKTYSSSKNLPKITKQTERSVEKIEELQDLCTVCKKLSALMEKVSNQVGNRNTTEFPIKCPLCQRYFISMFHLELHVATNHLQCQHEIPCKIAELPGVEKSSADVGLDCKKKTDIAFRCLRCSSKFNSEKDLTDHLAGTHDVRPRKEKTSNVHPDYIGDLGTSSVKTNGQKNVVVPCKSGDESRPKENKMTPATLDCSLCDEKFVESAKYVRHVREIHNTSKTLSYVNRKRNVAQSSSNVDKLRPMLEKPSPNVSKVSSTCKFDKAEKATGTKQADSAIRSDRDYVLKQLLSGDSSDSDDHDDTKQNFKTPRSKDSPLKVQKKESIGPKSKDKTVAECSSSLQTCGLSQKTHKIAEHLLFDKSHMDGKFTEDRSEVFVLSDSEDELNYEESDKATNDEFSPRKERVFVYNGKSERENVAVVFGTNGASEKVVIGSKRRANLASFEMSEISKVKKKKIPLEAQKISSGSGDQGFNSSEQEPRDARKYAMKQLIETEVGLTDEIDEKLPIACGKCNRHFGNRSLLNEHLFFLHDDSLKDAVLTDVLTPIGGLRGFDENESSQRWHCETCAQNFKLFQSYSRHRYFLHGDDSMVHVCENCSKVMTNVTMVNVHICTDVTSYNCRACNEIFPTGMSLRLHNTEKHMEKNGPHTCVVCKRNFLTNSMLERHKNSKRCSVRSYRAGKEISSSVPSPDTTNQLNRGEASKPAPKCVDEKIDKTATKRNVSGEEDSIMSCDPFALRRGRWRTCRSKRNVEEESPVTKEISNVAGSKKKRGRPAKNSLSAEKASAKRHEEDVGTKNFEKWPIVCKGSMLYVDETEIHQCALCQLYCLSRSTLRYHMAKIHSTTDEICQLCQKMYTTGKLIRHLIERHITAEDGQVFGPETTCRIGTNVNEIDAEILIKMLGIDRLVSLCEYRRFNDKNRLTSYPCLICKKYFASHELYKYHYLLHHDSICALCNIEFKTGQDAARHKSEIHGSVGRYIWFADRTVMALTSTTNFTNITETIFMEKITREEKASNDEAEEIDGNEEPPSATQVLPSKNASDDISAEKEGSVAKHVEIGPGDEKLGLDPDTGERIVVPLETAEKSIETTSKAPTKIVAEVPSGEATSVDTASSAPDRSSQRDDLSLIIVVTEDDLKQFNIATRHPNIWGLAAKISSTCDVVTPKQVKEMLERHFEREEDFDV